MPLRIALVTDWFAPRLGGIENQLVELARRLAGRGHRVDVITSTPGASSDKEYRVDRLDVLTLPGSQLAVSPLVVPALRARLARGYDVVHAHVSVVSPVGYAAAAIARTLDLPVVVTFHSVLRHKRALLRASDALFGISRSACVWTAVSDLVAGQASGALSGTEVRVLPNGIDLSVWRPTSRASGNGRPVTFVSTMRLHPKKRPRALIRAFLSAAAQARAPMRLLITGDGVERRAIERDLAQTTTRSVELRGWIALAELRQLYAQADAFVLASERESFGIAALEARAAGLPVIAMRASGSTEFLRHEVDALVCADDAELARSMTRFADTPALRRALQDARPDLGPYSWERVVAAHEAAYDEATRRAAVWGGAGAPSA